METAYRYAMSSRVEGMIRKKGIEGREEADKSIVCPLIVDLWVFEVN